MSNQDKINYLIDHYKMAPHPEGGFFSETYKSPEMITTDRGERSVCTAIYFLLRHGDISHFHRIKSDEIWHFYQGEELEIYEIDEAGEMIITKLTSDHPQYIVKAKRWFASKPADTSNFAFVGCTVSPGFEFSDFEMAKKSDLLAQFPQHKSLIEKLTLD